MNDTRKQILARLQRHPGLSVGDLAEHFKLSLGAVRHHLTILERDALISSESMRQPVGRPCIVYELTEKGEESFPKQYDRLSNVILDTVKEDQGSRGLRSFLRKVGDRIIEQSGFELQSDTSIEQRAQLLGAIMDREGFSLEWKRDENELKITQHSCPYQAVASSHQEVCQLDEHLIERVIGKPVKRLEHRSKGDCVCAFNIQLSDGTG